MLAAVGVASIDELFEVIPADIRRPDLNQPRALTEMEALRDLRNLRQKTCRSRRLEFPWRWQLQPLFPAVVNQMLLRGEFFTPIRHISPKLRRARFKSYTVPDHGCRTTWNRRRQRVALRRRHGRRRSGVDGDRPWQEA